MKILLFCGQFRPLPEGGAEKEAALQAAEFVRQGHEATVLTPRWSRAFPAEEAADGFRIVRIGRMAPLLPLAWRFHALCTGHPSERPVHAVDGVAGLAPVAKRRAMNVPEWIAWRSLVRDVARFAARERFDVVHVHGESFPWIRLGMLAARRWGVPVFAMPVSYPLFVTGYGKSALLAEAGRTPWALRFIALTDAIRDALVADGVPPERISVVPNGTPWPVRRAAGGGKTAVLVANLTQGARWKGFDTALQAWPEVVRRVPDAHLRFIGGGDPSEWRACAERLGVAGAVEFAGYVEGTDAMYPDDVALAILPSRREGLPMAIIEAAARGIPAVVTDIPAFRAVVPPEVGVRVPVDDAHALADAVAALLADEPRRRALGDAARRRAGERHAIQVVCGRLADLYLRESDISRRLAATFATPP